VQAHPLPRERGIIGLRVPLPDANTDI